jgi:hypothetical protein
LRWKAIEVCGLLTGKDNKRSEEIEEEGTKGGCIKKRGVFESFHGKWCGNESSSKKYPGIASIKGKEKKRVIIIGRQVRV